MIDQDTFRKYAMAQELEREHRGLLPLPMQHVGWGGKTRTIQADFVLGIGTRRGVLGHDRFGLSAAAYDIAYGYVSGFRKRDITYYVLTRSLSRRVWCQTFRRENPGRLGCRSSCARCNKDLARRA